MARFSSDPQLFALLLVDNLPARGRPVWHGWWLGAPDSKSLAKPRLRLSKSVMSLFRYGATSRRTGYRLSSFPTATGSIDKAASTPPAKAPITPPDVTSPPEKKSLGMGERGRRARFRKRPGVASSP